MLPRHKVVGLEETHWSTAAALVCAEQPRSTAISRAAALSGAATTRLLDDLPDAVHCQPVLNMQSQRTLRPKS